MACFCCAKRVAFGTLASANMHHLAPWEGGSTAPLFQCNRFGWFAGMVEPSAISFPSLETKNQRGQLSALVV